MKALPYSIFKVVQGLSYPRQSEIRFLSDWDTSDFACTQIIVDEISATTDIVVVSLADSGSEGVIRKLNQPKYNFHVVIFSHVEEDIQTLYGKFNPTIIQAREAFLGIIIDETAETSFLSRKIVESAPINIDNPQFFIPSFEPSLWSQEKNRITYI